MLEKRDPDVIQSYFEDNSGLTGGYAEAVAFPENEGELSEFLRRADERRLPVTVSGGGTGVCGARIPFGGVVISMEKMNRISKIEKGASAEIGYAVVQPGVRVEDFTKAVEATGLIYPCAPTEESALLGGTVATNASGARSYKYGPTRKYVMRLKVALADGTILDIRRGETLADDKREFEIAVPHKGRMRFIGPDYKMPSVKNAAGYHAKDRMDLIDLFIGQEGTLGVIAEIEVALERRPENIFSCFAFFGSERDSLDFSREVKRISARTRQSKEVSEIEAISLEYFDHNSLEILRTKHPKIPEGAHAAIFFEQELTEAAEDELLAKWQELLERHHVLAENTWAEVGAGDRYGFKDIRHDLPDTINEIVKRNQQPKVGTDIAVPEDRFDEMMDFYLRSLQGSEIRHAIFGHIGENHLHVNLLPGTDGELRASRDICLEFVKKGALLGGTVSAEHGIGKIKHRYLEELYGMDGLKEMARVKKSLDPNCILGRGNIFPEELLK